MQTKTRKQTALERGRTNHISMTHDPDLQSLKGMVMTYHTHKKIFKVNDQSVPKMEWKQMDRQTDRGDCITSLANADGKNMQLYLNEDPCWLSTIIGLT